MDSSFAQSDIRETCNFEFAFNSVNFSDRVLKIQIVAESKSSGQECISIADWGRHRKRKRENIKEGKGAEIAVVKKDIIVDADRPDSEDRVQYENPDGEEVAMIKESPSGDEPSHSSDSSWSMDSSPILRVREVYISSAILAAKSPFFYKLFSNGMRESKEKHATLRINASEEVALMELLSFIYSGKLSTVSAPAVLDVLVAAHKFDVASCTRYCSQVLRSQSMTNETALLFLELPSSVSMASAVRPLTDAAKEFLANKYRDLSKSQDEVMDLPLAGIEAVLSSDILHVSSEDAVYDFLLKWACAQYPKLEERKEILGSRLGRLVRFPFMTCRKLRKVLSCNDVDSEIASKVVREALFFKVEMPHRPCDLASADHAADSWFVERDYKYLPVKLVEFKRPHPQCIAYLDLKKEECAKLFPSGRIYSQAFRFCRRWFFISAHCHTDQHSQSPRFGFLLAIKERSSDIAFRVDYELAVRTRPAGDFVSKYKGYYSYTRGKAVGFRNLLATPWPEFMAEDNVNFINGVLHLRAELTIKQPQKH